MKPSTHCDKRGGGDVEGPVIDGCTCNCSMPLLRPQQTQSHAALPSSDGERYNFQPRCQKMSLLSWCHRGCRWNKENLGECNHTNRGAFTLKVIFLPHRGVNLKTNGRTPFFNGFSHTCLVLTHVMLLRLRETDSGFPVLH